MKTVVAMLLFAVGTVSAVYAADPPPVCGTFIIVKGDDTLMDPWKMTCAPSEPIVVVFINNGTKAHRIRLVETSLKSDKTQKLTPVTNFKTRFVELEPGDHYTLGQKAGEKIPAVLDNSFFKSGSGSLPNAAYSFMIRLTNKGSDSDGKSEIDPELDVTPPNPILEEIWKKRTAARK